MSVSLLFLTPSVQLGTQTLPLHSPPMQSASTVQLASGAQPGHTPPPQSLSLSRPFLTPSLHDAAAQIPCLHTPSLQSAALMHALVGAHVAPQLPPQSTSVSPAFFWPSTQLAARHWPWGPHTWLEQSAAWMHSTHLLTPSQYLP
jgi:hypothetical protein